MTGGTDPEEPRSWCSGQGVPTRTGCWWSHAAAMTEDGPPTGEQAEHLTAVFREMDARIGQPVHYGRGDSTCGTQAYQTHWTDEPDVTTTWISPTTIWSTTTDTRAGVSTAGWRPPPRAESSGVGSSVGPACTVADRDGRGGQSCLRGLGCKEYHLRSRLGLGTLSTTPAGCGTSVTMLQSRHIGNILQYIQVVTACK